MPAITRELEGGHITYEAAAKRDENIINQLAYVPARKALFKELWNQRQTFEDLTRHHLRLDKKVSCTVLHPDTWIRGSFNVCVPVQVNPGPMCRRLIFRCPMPHKLAETTFPGTVDEKLSCEVGMYAWMQEKCPDVRIPHLYSFSFSDHRHFTHQKHRPFYVRLVHMFRCYIHRLMRYPDTLSQYTSNPISHKLPTAYMLIEFIGPETGQILSNTWETNWRDKDRRQKLFRGMAHIVLSLARTRQPRIGSFRFHDDGTISLANRRLLCSMAIMENDGAPRTINRNDTYTSTEPFVSDMLTFHDNSFLSNPNAVYDDDDCRGQMAAKTLLRALSHHYIRRENRNGPFILQLTDFHASNLMVDDEWNVTCLLDLEWICALPIEMLAAPYWLTGCGIDQIEDEQYNEYDGVRKEFMDILREEERNIATTITCRWKALCNKCGSQRGYGFGIVSGP